MRWDLRKIRQTIPPQGGGFQPEGDTLNLLEAIETYVQQKRSLGLDYSTPARIFRSLGRHVGNLSLERVTASTVLTFLDGPKTSPATWEKKYDLLRGFFDYWLARGLIEVLPMPLKQRARRQPFIPYIYTHTEIRALLRAVRRGLSETWCRNDSLTLRTLLIFIYGTGAKVGEALELQIDDVDLVKGAITIGGNRFDRSRTVPIGPDMNNVLGKYLASRQRKEAKDGHFFLTKDGEGLNSTTIVQIFRRLRRIAGIARHDSNLQPRMFDLRHTFAVHRIAGWIKHGADLNRMLPALAVYMGLTGLRSTEPYLSLTPERFRAQLIKLSPRSSKKRWRDDSELMRFLSQLSADFSQSRTGNGCASDRGNQAVPSATACQVLKTRRSRV